MKQVILVRADLNLPNGKMAAQVAHASVEAVGRSAEEKVSSWKEDGAKKVVLRVKDKEELFSYQQKAKAEGLVASVITDAGHTVVEPGTITCMAIGPDKEELIDRITGNLKMY
ncbi:MAG: peptidyl-tRNA hydrolase [DPANN group archaeon]|nr:peptidyl-tRNA hydrolase [DPANN group archaeon]